jgi:hypothetical protein
MRRSVRRRPPRARSIDAIETVVYGSFVVASCVRAFVRLRTRGCGALGSGGGKREALFCASSLRETHARGGRNVGLVVIN